ncbi:MAG: M12 family metallo-peptidase [Opitutaceae bacterium]|nr:M12 family metallo-peptidase [Opitutaceae bacterium]
MNETAYESNSNAKHRRPLPSHIRSVAASLVVALTTLSAAHAETASIDVLVVYTAAVKADQGDHDGVVATAQAIIAKGTLGFENSLIDAKFNLVHVEEIAYTESLFSYEDDLDAITNEDGVVDNVLTLREDWGADVVCLLRNGSIGGTAGLGWVLKDETGRDTTGFSVASVQSAVSRNTFAHEVGHNLGASHDAFADNADPNGGLYLYSHGHHFDGGTPESHRTIMAYQKSFNNQVNFFSNPNVSHLGAPTGIAEGNVNPADNARTLTTTTPVVAGYRVHQTPIPSFPTPFPNFAFVEGQSKTILAQAVGTPDLSYQWYEGVSGDTSNPVGAATDASFTTPVLNQTTVYWVRATNPNGSGDSPSITLTTTVAPSEPNVLDPNSNHNPGNQGDAYLQFSVSNGEVWQEFVPSFSYLHQLEINLWKNGTPGRMSLKLTDSNNVVLFSKIYEEGDIPSTNEWLDVPLQMYVNTDETYRITLQRLDAKALDSILVNAIDQLEDLSSNIFGTDVPAFVADNDTITIGDSEKFEELFFWLDTPASGSGVSPIFEFSTGIDTWSTFTPTDNTNGLTNNFRTIEWNNASIPLWTTGAGSELLIRITRTADTVTTNPVLFQVQDRHFLAWLHTEGDSYPAGDASLFNKSQVPTDHDYYFRTTGSSASPPTADIDPTEKTIAGGAGSYDITVTSTGDWTVLEALDWVSLIPTIGNGNGTVTVTVTANNTGSERSGLILVAGNNHSITQSASPFEGSIDPLKANFLSTGGNGSVKLTTEHPWSASSDSWITITSPTSGTGDATVNYTVAENTSPSARTGTVTIESLQHTVQQFGTILTFDEWLLSFYTSEEIAALTPSAREADSDGDGLNNNGEFLLLLDPSSRNSGPQIIATKSSNGIVLTISPQIDGVVYRLNASTDMITWTPEPSLTPTVIENTVTFTIPTGSEKFFQLEIEATAP